jgi:hypothetical protein
MLYHVLYSSNNIKEGKHHVQQLNTDLLLERAKYVSERYVGTYLPEAIDNLIKANDLEKLEYMVKEAEFDLANEDTNGGKEMGDEF